MEDMIQVFDNSKFGMVRIIEENGDTLFCASDLCNALGYSNGRQAIINHVDEADVTKRDMGVVTGKKADGTDIRQTVKATFVNESGLYSLIIGSKLPSARDFKRWITSEVLPEIRKHGAYLNNDIIEKTLSDPDYLIQLATIIKEERRLRKKAEADNKKLEAINKRQKPKAVLGEAVSASRNSCLIGELAKIITQNGFKIGQNRLFSWLRENNYLGTSNSFYNIPNQKYVEQGIFEIKKSVRYVKDEPISTVTAKVTGKGQEYFINKFLPKCSKLNDFFQGEEIL